MGPLIPGLLDEVAELCLTRIPRSEFRTISHVCSRWRRLIMREHYAAILKMSGSVEEQFMCVLMDNMYWEVFDGSGNTMGQIPPIPGPLKCGYGLMVLDGRKIVLVGGKYKARRSKVRGLKVRRAFEVREPAFANAVSANVHEFNPATNRWRKLADMNIPRHNFACAEVEGLLYVIRGYSADDVSILNAEVYNPKTNKWSLMDCPHRPNFCPAFAFSFNSKLFVVGNKSRFIDIYDPRKKTWEELDSGQTLDVYSYTVVSNKVYFLNRYRSGVGVFDPEKNSWSSVDVPKTFSRSSLGQLNNKVILYSRGIGYGLDKEDKAKWRATPITISGFEAISVVINF
ncbi:putative F-box/kelch-repeat protein At1g27420 [Raphanus sativus]|uniref:F-box/kelch-repeat protein At1g27420 n=1 Tax=Raphanus sativus TaxID=3726 RepID=A0A6J0KK92_RAPSA|nr:putative F-box/kelch-repeat protein At1g27420 [Raphanus sativus]